MANYKAVASGNWSNLATWQDNSSGSFVASTVLPGAADVVYWNNFTVAIDQDVTVLQIRNDSTTGVSAGGGGTVSTSRTINADLIAGSVSGSSTITISAGIGNTVNINGNIFGSNSASSFNIYIALSITGTCIVNFVGNITSSQQGANHASPTINITGGATMNITGDITSGIQNGATTGTRAVQTGNNATINMVGNIYAGLAGQANHGIGINGTNTTVNVTGNLYGGVSLNSLNQNAAICFTTTAAGSNVVTTGTLFAGSDSLALRADLNAIGKFTHNGIIINGTTGNMAVSVPYLFLDSTSTEWEFRKSNLTTNTLYTPGVATGHPATNNVRTGVVYGPTNNLTGTCAVPPANAVSVGVPVDNTVGTAQLDANALAVALDAALTASLAPALTTSLDASLSASLPAAIAPLLWDEDVTNITTPNSIGERLKNCATVATTGAQISSFNP